MARGVRLRLVPHRGAMPHLLRHAPAPVLLLAGLALVVLGSLMVTRPLTSIVLLGVYVAMSAAVFGVAELESRRGRQRWWTWVPGVGWIVAGVVILLLLNRSLDLIPRVIAVLLLFGGVVSIGNAVAARRWSVRVLAVAWGLGQLVFGILALTWPDVTVLVVAVVFGLRTLLTGSALVVRAISEPTGSTLPTSSTRLAPGFATRPAPPAQAWAAVGRYALALVIVAASASGWLLNGWLAEGAPVVDSFYDPPTTVPAEHGRLIRVDEFPGTKPPDADVSRILYTTRDALGNPAVASAIVVVPSEDRAGARPVVAWNHGTTGIARGCAPSLRDASATHWAIPGLNDAIDRGWVVVASDYVGQGAPGVFPYLIGKGEARSSLDAVLAAREIPGLALRPETVAWGHSQGGHAALWMSKIAGEYAPSIDLTGTAVLAPVVDPLALAREIRVRNADPLLSVLTSWVLVPYADTYPDVDLADYIAPGSRTLVREMSQRCPTEPGVIVSVLTAIGVSEDRPLYVGDLTTGALGDRLAANAAVGPWPTPLLVAWGDADEVIPPALQEEFVDAACADGGRVRWAVYAGYTHLQPLLPGSRFLPVLIDWTEGRLLGTGTPDDDCGRYAGD